MSITHTDRYALPAPNGDDLIVNGDNVMRDLTTLLDAIMATAYTGPIASRPATGKLGRVYVPDDVPGRIDFDTGDGWLSIGGRAPGQAPVGSVMDYAGAADPADGSWLICDGRSLLRADYPDLVVALDVAGAAPFGAVDGTHFNLPDFVGRFAAAPADPADVGQSGGADTVTLVASQMPSHAHQQQGTIPMFPYTDGGSGEARIGEHGFTDPGVINFGDFAVAGNPSGEVHLSGNTGTAGANGSHENRPPYLTVNKIIRVA